MAETTEQIDTNRTDTGVDSTIQLAGSDQQLKKMYSVEYASEKTRAWLSCELRLDDFSIKNQSFQVTGWINVFWKWQENNIPAPAKALAAFNGINDENGDECKGAQKDNYLKSQTIIYRNSKGEEIVKVGDLRPSDVTYYLPIDANRIFYQPSLQEIKHIDAPVLYYNKTSKLVHTQYYINAVLLEHLELFMFPFDRQFLNLKLRWNVDFYQLLDYERESHVPVDQQWWGQSGEKSCERSKDLFHTRPLKVSLKESLQNEVKMYPAWVDFRIRHRTQDSAKDAESNGLRFALIRLRVRRNPMYFVTNIIFPFFIIVSSSFSVFAISPQDIGDRLSVSVTILLTFTAFQSIIADELPQTSDMLLIDWYIGVAYLLQALLILGSCIVSLDILKQEVIEQIDMFWAFISVIFWVLFSLFYVSMRYKTLRNCYDRCCCKCCCLGKINYNDWDRRGNEEINNWIINNKEAVSWNKIVRNEDTAEL